MGRLQFKTRVFTAIVILANVFGNAALTFGMKRVGDPGFSPLLYLKAIFNPWVMMGIMLLILWMFSRMALLSWADLSYVLPVTSAGYIIQAVIGKYLFGEQISPARWAGAVLIVGGVALVGMTSPRTARPENAALESESAFRSAA